MFELSAVTRCTVPVRCENHKIRHPLEDRKVFCRIQKLGCSSFAGGWRSLKVKAFFATGQLRY